MLNYVVFYTLKSLTIKMRLSATKRSFVSYPFRGGWSYPSSGDTAYSQPRCDGGGEYGLVQ